MKRVYFLIFPISVNGIPADERKILQLSGNLKYYDRSKPVTVPVSPKNKPTQLKLHRIRHILPNIRNNSQFYACEP